MWYGSKAAPCEALQVKDEALILNEFTLGYGLMSGMSLVGGLGASALGLSLASKNPEILRSSRLTSLVTTLVFVGLWMRLAMVPLWFWMLSSLVPSIPGAMCLWGVHNANPPISWIATGFKILLPFFYGFWIAVHSLDIRHDEQPLLRQKILLLIPLGILLVIESLADLAFLWPLEPIRVTCCTSAYRKTLEGAIGGIYALNHPWGAWAYFLSAAMIVAVALGSILKRTFSFSWDFVACFLSVSFLCLFSLVYTLQAELSLNLVLPRHACIFCLWKQFPDVALASLLAFLGIFFFVLFVFLGGLTGRRGVDERAAKGPIETYAWLTLGFLALGTLDILARWLITP